jgi:hypothetical protein
MNYYYAHFSFGKKLVTHGEDRTNNNNNVINTNKN